MESGSFPVIYLDYVVPMFRMGSVGVGGGKKKTMKKRRKEVGWGEGKRERDEKALVYYFLPCSLKFNHIDFLAIP